MKSVYQLFILSVFAVVLFSCYGGVDPQMNEELQVYVERFKEEAKARGLNYDARVEEIDITIAEILIGGVLGQCINGSQENSAIEIDRTYWNLETTTDLDKEFVMFHELGHCVLQRGHLNSPDTDGVCISMMYDGNSVECMLEYFSENRDEMIDELFQ